MSLAPPTPPAPAPVPAPAAPAVPPRLLMTRAEFEAAADDPGTRCEWLGYTDETRDGEPLGEVWPRFGFDPDGSFLMANAIHSRISSNVFIALAGAVDRDRWYVLAQDAEVGCSTGRHRFPDIVVTPEPPEYAPAPGRVPRVLLNPAVCVEVLSDSTAAVDLTEKTADYLSVPSVTDYLVVGQTREVLHHRRASGEQPARWRVTRHTDPAAAVDLTAPPLTLPLADIYRRVPGAA